MKTLSFLPLSLMIVTLFLLSSCQQKQPKETVKIDQAFQEYVSGFTSGLISSRATIRVKLSKEYMQDVKAGDPIDVQLFSFEPSIKGQAFWVDESTVEFRPSGAMLSGTEYVGHIALKKIIDVPVKFSSLPLQFQVIKQSFQVREGELQQVPTGGKSIYTYSGSVVTADVMDNDAVEELLLAKMEGEVLLIEWEHKREAKEHLFVVKDVKRKESDAILSLEWDGGTQGIEVADRREVEIPGLSNFKLISSFVYHQPSQYLLLTFSDPLLKSQNLKGLITIQEAEVLRLVIQGNRVKVFLSKRISGEHELTVEKGVKNSSGYKLVASKSQKITFEASKPNVRLIGKGIIIPKTDGLIFPFEAINLKAVDIKVIKIFEDNVSQFLQVNSLAGERDIRRVGRLLVKKKIDLVSDNLIDYGKWNAFSFDLSELIENEPGAIYRIEITFRKRYSLYPCVEEVDDEEELAVNWDEEDLQEQSYWDGTGYYYNSWYNYDWRDRDNPCTPSYYRNKKVSRNVLASNIGVIAKAGSNGELRVFVTDLLTTAPLSGVEVEVLNYQQQLIGTAKTDGQGMLTLKYTMKPYLLIAKNGDQRGYLKLNDGVSLSLSRYDVGGARYERGLKGFIYGERGVWRPGDTIYTTFILEDKEGLLPSEHPVSFELVNPHGKVMQRQVKSSSENGFYAFTSSTAQDAPTGNWTARIRVGGSSFAKQIKIETIKPNRLKINLDFEKKLIRKDDLTLSGRMEVKWLHGAIAKNMKAEVDMELRKVKTTFMSYNDYVFDDPSVSFNVVEKRVFSGRLDAEGVALIKPDIKISGQVPGMLSARFNTKVFEEGGNFSVNQMSIPYAPYSTFVGVKLPKGDKMRGMLLTDEKHTVDVVTLDAEGQKVSQKNLVAKLYKVEWRWWWQSGSDNVGSYIKRKQIQPVLTRKFSTVDGFGSFEIEVKYPSWGRYLVQVEIPGGHSTGKAVYIDWPGWAGRAQDENSGGASMLSFSADKKEYKVGESVKVTLPSSAGGRALVSIEKGAKVLDAYWVEAQDKMTNFEFEVTPEMAPNVYINVTLLQPHSQTVNDLPIRLYGIVPIMVEDPDTKIYPVITMADELKPESKVKVSVAEKSGRPMTFTLAVVDEGLLDLTNYKTPSPWRNFYAREALSVRSWDMYDMVLGAYGAKIEASFAIGGDGDLDKNKGKKARRFKPVVKYFGPYTIGKGKSKSIEFDMPRYVGSVKTMVVASSGKAYGEAEKITPVKNPLMIFATLPRVLSPEESVKLPVTLFSLDDTKKEVEVELKVNDKLVIIGESVKTIHFDRAGEQDFTFDVKSADALGIAKVEVVARSGNDEATYEIELDVRAPNPNKIVTYSAVVESGEYWNQTFDLFGIMGSNKVRLEVSGMPPINMDRRLRCLTRYPYGCVEQTTSAAFPQLYLSDVTELNAEMKTRTKGNIEKALVRLNSFQLSSGGFSYWPGRSRVADWATSYVGHFILEAEAKGYVLPVGMKDAFLSYQREQSNNWRPAENRYYSFGLAQAYRLFTLALADEANLGAMNRLKEYDHLCVQGKCLLGLAYSYSGNKDAAIQLIANVDKSLTKAIYYRSSYGSRDRDLAIVLEVLLALELHDEAMVLIKNISDRLNSGYWMNTQATSFCLRSMAKAAALFKGSLDEFNYSFSIDGGKEKDVMSTTLVSQYDVAMGEGIVSKQFALKNESPTPFYVNLSVEGIPLVDDGKQEQKNLEMKVGYKNLDGKLIDPSSLEQGMDFKVEVQVKHPGYLNDYEDMALSIMVPSGWEIINTRLYGGGASLDVDVPEYEDIRDDRVNLFFGLDRHKTKTFVVLLNASYLGTYNLPAIQCSAMYNNEIRARISGREVEVIKSK